MSGEQRSGVNSEGLDVDVTWVGIVDGEFVVSGESRQEVARKCREKGVMPERIASSIPAEWLHL